MEEVVVAVDGLIEVVVVVAAVDGLIGVAEAVTVEAATEAEELQALSEIKKRKLLYSTVKSESSL